MSLGNVMKHSVLGASISMCYSDTNHQPHMGDVLYRKINKLLSDECIMSHKDFLRD